MTQKFGLSRRGFLRTTGVLSATGAASGPVSAQQNNSSGGSQSGSGNQTGGGGGGSGKPDYGGWLDGVSNYNGNTVDKRGSKEVTIEVGTEGNGGNYAFTPPAVWVDPGTKVIWKWTGKGGNHNVHAMEGADFSSNLASSEGHTYTQTIEKGGMVKYQCDPHAPMGMKGALAVGNNVPTVSAGGGGPVDPKHMGVPIQAHYVGLATILMIIVSTIFTFFLLKYGESPHTKGGN